MSVSTAQVQGLSQSLQSRAKQIAAILEDLERQIQVLQSSWDGKARDAYQQAQRQWTTQANRLQQLAADIARATGEIASGYDQFDAQAAAQF
jgi:early secretory antigenic target protein ESAT-6